MGVLYHVIVGSAAMDVFVLWALLVLELLCLFCLFLVVGPVHCVNLSVFRQ